MDITITLKDNTLTVLTDVINNWQSYSLAFPVTGLSDLVQRFADNACLCYSDIYNKKQNLLILNQVKSDPDLFNQVQTAISGLSPDNLQALMGGPIISNPIIVFPNSGASADPIILSN